MATAARAVRERITQAQPADVSEVTKLLADEFAAVGGSMGALSYVLFEAVGEAAASADATASAHAIAQLLAAAEEAVTSFGGARRGDKTMVDAMCAAREAAVRCAEDDLPVAETLRQVAAAGSEGARRTTEMVPRIGRASRLGDRALGSQDPGATTVAIVLTAIADAYAPAVGRS
jgi:dihydroxyacetone kinase